MSRALTITAVLVSALAWLMVSAMVPAQASTGDPQWTVRSVSRPTNFKPGDNTGQDVYVVNVMNTGGASSDGSPITVTDELPGGLSLDPVGASGLDDIRAGVVGNTPEKGAKLVCVFGTCTYTGVVVPDDTLVVEFPVDVLVSESSSLTNVVRVSGGGAPDATMETPTTISTEPAKFGISPGGATTALSTTQAGAHPDITGSIAFNTVDAQGSLAGDPKETVAEFPAGFGSDFVDTPTCSPTQFSQGECPVGSQVGVITLAVKGAIGGQNVKPVYDLSPGPGEVAKLGFAVLDTIVEGSFTLRPDDYGATVTFPNINSGLVEVENASLTVWGVPADPIHNTYRVSGGANTKWGISSDASPVPFVTNPTLCSGRALEAKFTVRSWQQPEQSIPPTPMLFGPIVGCDRLTMEPEMTAEPTTSRAYAPTGLNVNARIPQTYDNAYGLATSNLKRAVVILPEGMTVNPSAGAGLGACSPSQFAEEGVQSVPGSGCPNTSKLGSVKAQSPALKEEATGSVFIAEPYDNPFKSLLALYVVARIPDRGVIVKFAGEVTADPVTGRLVTTFDNLPPLPVGAFTFSFHQGQTSPLVTPPACGNYTVTAELTPWSNPEGAPLMPPIPAFPITSGFDGGACPAGGVPPFAPQVLAGTQNNLAGSYSPMYIRVVRSDGEQEVTRFSARLPSGLTANLTGVPFCPDADIQLARGRTGAQEEAEPSCPAASQIGHALGGAGVGSVLAQTHGKLYMAGPYNGAPFSVVAIFSAKVGPFDLGTVVVRVALRIDPSTAVVTVDSSASDPIPHIIRGIVVHVRDVRVYIDRPNFTLNPTSCERMDFAVTVDGSGADFTNPADQVPVTIDDPFQAADCQSLRFKPAFKVSTSGRTSRVKGASLTAKLSYPSAPQGSQANIRSVKVDLPKQLPSRLTTLQKACPDTTFDANPAACPPASIVGQAKAVTPILPVPLTGPAYFVSHGGAKFPELIIVLQGYGVTLDLHGETFISKAGITSSTFRTIPDAPVGTFELTLPQGKYSALAANGNLCKSSLKMPTVFTAQNGMVIRQATPIRVSGCAKHKVRKAARRGRHGKGRQRKGK
jgi:hypothetical protein